MGYALPYPDFHVGSMQGMLDLFRNAGHVEVLRFEPEARAIDVKIALA